MTTSFSTSCGHGSRSTSLHARTGAPSDDRGVEKVSTRPPDVRPSAGAVLVTVLGEATRAFHASSDLDGLLAEVVATGVRLVPGAQAASLSLVTRHQVAAQHPTSELARSVELVQTRVAEGPCLDAVHHGVSIHVSDLDLEPRWPTFTPDARRLGLRSVFSSPLSVGDRTLGALNLFSREPDAFDEEAWEVGLLVAGQAAVALATLSKHEQLQRAVGSRDLIGQAKGILMERYGLDQERAFGVLTRVSQTSHRKLHDIAHDLVTTGRIEELTMGGRPPR